MNNLNIVFLGTTEFSFKIFHHLLDNDIVPKLVFTMTKEFSISYSSSKVQMSTFADFPSLCEEKGIPYHIIESQSNHRIQDFESEIKAVKPDIILVMGWYYMVPKKIRDIATYGAWGIHASLLPNYAGGAPLTWAIINGETETGATLFRLSDGVDDGDIIDQKSVSIDDDDTIKEVYQKIIDISGKMLVQSLNMVPNVEFTPQDLTQQKVFPQRNPDDGEIDLTKSAKEIYNFIRAQSDPYPGAFIKTQDGKKIIIEKARIVDLNKENNE